MPSPESAANPFASSVCRIAYALLFETPSARPTSDSVMPSWPASASVSSSSSARSTLWTR